MDVEKLADLIILAIVKKRLKLLKRIIKNYNQLTTGGKLCGKVALLVLTHIINAKMRIDIFAPIFEFAADHVMLWAYSGKYASATKYCERAIINTPPKFLRQILRLDLNEQYNWRRKIYRVNIIADN